VNILAGAAMAAEDFLPLSAADLQLLLILTEGERHAYGIASAAEAEDTKVPLELGSLYRMLARLSEAGLIEEDPTPRPSPSGPRRKVYRITGLGRDVAAAEVRRLRQVVGWAEGRLGMEGGTAP
jgi:DNA-binding PadR family transcriptional regulator